MKKKNCKLKANKTHSQTILDHVHNFCKLKIDESHRFVSFYISAINTLDTHAIKAIQFDKHYVKYLVRT